MKRKLRIIPLILTAMILLSSCSEQIEEPVINDVVEETTSKRPHLEDDYYGYANWDFIDTAQIPYGKSSYSTFSMQQDAIEERINHLIEEYAESNPKQGTNEQKIKDIYLQYFDEETRKEVGIEPFNKALDTIDKAENIDDFIEASALLFAGYGCDGIFSMYAEVDAYDSSAYVPTIDQMNLFRLTKNTVTDDSTISSIGDFSSFIFKKLGASEEEAKQKASGVVAMIADIAAISLTSDYLMEIPYIYNPYTPEEFSKLYSNIDTNAMLKAYNIDSKKVVVVDVGQAEKINEYLTEENLSVLKDYAIITLFAKYRSCLPPDYLKSLDMINESVFDKNKAAYDIVNNSFSREISAIYGENFCSAETKKEISKMVDDIKKSIKERIEQSDRLSNEGKEKLKKKLDNIVANIGDYDNGYSGNYSVISSDKGGNLLDNVITIYTYNTNYDLQKYKNKPKRTAQAMGTPSANAVYNPYLNSITIPAGMMSDYFYDPDRPYAYNLGMVGFCIGHELNHAFDSHGFLFDENGCYNENWFDKEDKEAYKKVQEEIIEYYNHYKLLDVYGINGSLTLGENIADIGSMECLTKIVDGKENLQFLFEGYAYSWASVDSVSTAVELLRDEHSPGEARVNAVISTIDEFYEIYNIAETDGMYISPEDRVKVW